MFDFGLGSTELLMIAIIALIVVGPKDLPKLLRTIGKYVGKIKTMAREFQGHIEDAAKETGVDDLKKEFTEAGSFDFDEDFKQQEEELSKVFEDAALDLTEKPEQIEADKSEPVAKKTTVKKSAAKKPAVKKPAAKKPAARKTAARKTAAKKPAAKKPTRKPAKKS